MGLVKLADLRPGMVLAQPALDRKGNKILREGMTLTARHFEVLKAWKVAAVDVQGVDEVSLEELEAKVAGQAEASAQLREIEARFAGADDELRTMLRDEIKRRFLKKVAQG